MEAAYFIRGSIWLAISLFKSCHGLCQTCLQLLDYHFADENVRCCAVKRLQQLQNDELQLYLLQLVQVINSLLYAHHVQYVGIYNIR